MDENIDNKLDSVETFNKDEHQLRVKIEKRGKTLKMIIWLIPLIVGIIVTVGTIFEIQSNSSLERYINIQNESLKQSISPLKEVNPLRIEKTNLSKLK